MKLRKTKYFKLGGGNVEINKKNRIRYYTLLEQKISPYNHYLWNSTLILLLIFEQRHRLVWNNQINSILKFSITWIFITADTILLQLHA